jgi:phospholipid/cholesterol/gamma-HCH transport system substrate-binding protein
MRRGVEVAVGLFVLFGIACLGYISLYMGEMPILGSKAYPVLARFDSVGGLVKGASVEIGGVPIGRVDRISLVNYRPEVVMRIQPSVQLQDDAIASIRTKGIVGETFVAITPGGSPKIVPSGGTLRQTESAVDLEQLISTFIHGKI